MSKEIYTFEYMGRMDIHPLKI